MGRAERLTRTGDDPVLKQVCDAVAPGERLTFLEDMELVCRKLRGVGLAAPQIGQAKRVILVRAGATPGAIAPSAFMINPVIVKRSDETDVGDEGCLSYPGVTARVERHDWVEV